MWQYIKSASASLIALLILSTCAWAQGGSISGIVVQPAPPTGTGGPAPFSSIRVCPYAGGSGTPCSPLANLFLDPGLTITSPNPATTDQHANYSLWVSPQPYIVQITPVNGIVYSYLVMAVAGTVTSISITLPTSVFTSTGCTITSFGTCAFSFISQSANQVFASPTTGPGIPLFRAIVGPDFGPQSANTVLGNCTGSAAPPVFCPLTSNMIPGTLNATNFSGNVSITGAASIFGNTSITGATAITGSETVTGNGSFGGTLSAASFPSPVITNPTINGAQIMSGVQTAIVTQNYSVGGTALNTLTKLTNTGGASAVVEAATTDTSGVIGITSAGAGTTGNATVITSGAIPCIFDNAPTGGDYVQISPSVAGNCHDAGATYPLSGQQVVGRSTITSGSSGTYTMVLFGPEIHGGASLGNGSAAVTVDPLGSGTGGAASCPSCQDKGGLVSVLAGTSAFASQRMFTITFSQSYTHAWCTISAANDSAVGVGPISLFTASSNLQVLSGLTGLSSSTLYEWMYTCNLTP